MPSLWPPPPGETGTTRHSLLLGFCVSVGFILAFSHHRGECTDSLRSRIRELESECKKLTHDMKFKEEQIRELELKAQVSYHLRHFRRRCSLSH